MSFSFLPFTSKVTIDIRTVDKILDSYTKGLFEKLLSLGRRGRKDEEEEEGREIDAIMEMIRSLTRARIFLSRLSQE